MKTISGFLDEVSANYVRGWAMDRESDEPLTIRLMVDGVMVGEGCADQVRLDLLAQKIHPTGKCGFQILFGSSLSPFSTVRVLAGIPEEDLHHSPWVYLPEAYFPYPEYRHILIFGLAKSGTTGLTYTIASGVKGAKIAFEPGSLEAQYDLNGHIRLVRENEKLITKCLFYPNHPRQLESIGRLYNRRVWIIRDPRDVLLSSFFYMWYYGHHPEQGKFEKALRLVKEKEADPCGKPFCQIVSSFFDPKVFLETRYLRIIDYLKANRKNWFLLKYEDFVDGKLKQLGEYLEMELTPDAPVEEKYKRVIRSKRYGNWRIWFTPEDVSFFQPFCQPILQALGYDEKDWQLRDSDSLDSREGSEYMEKLFKGELK